MTEAERAAWAAFEQGIIDDAVEAGLIDSAEEALWANKIYYAEEAERARRASVQAVRAAMKAQYTPGTAPRNWPWTPREG